MAYWADMQKMGIRGTARKARMWGWMRECVESRGSWDETGDLGPGLDFDQIMVCFLFLGRKQMR